MALTNKTVNFNIKKGFRNFRNTCFYNSTLQSIFRCEQLIETLTDYRGNNRLLIDLSKTIRDYYFDDNVTVVGPTLLLQSYCNMNSDYRIGSQEDAQECLTYFLDNFAMATDAEGVNIKSLFDCNLTSVLECTNCKHTSEKIDPEKIISIEINKFLTFEEAIANFLSVEKLGNDELWLCEKCNMKIGTNKKLTIKGSPKYLYIHLKRFKHEYIKELNKVRISKIGNPITMPDELEINNYKYELIGTIMHMGDLNFGHYVYYHKFDNTWSQFNDKQILSMNSDVDEIKKFGYIYLYQKI